MVLSGTKAGDVFFPHFGSPPVLTAVFEDSCERIEGQLLRRDVAVNGEILQVHVRTFPADAQALRSSFLKKLQANGDLALR